MPSDLPDNVVTIEHIVRLRLTMMGEPADMVLFAAVVREGSFTKAATRLGITKQTASERIGKLEARLGVRLLERTTRRLRVTEPGAIYYERCAAIATQIDEANAEVRRRQVEPVGLLRVTAPVLYGRRYLAPVVAHFLRRHPKVRIELVLADRRVDLIEEGFDLAIRVGPLDDSSLAFRKLGEGHAYVVASPALLRAHPVTSVAHLRAAPAVGTRFVETWEVKGTRIEVEPTLVVNDLEAACDAAVAGVGVARVPAIVCREPVADGRLRVLFGPMPALLVSVYAVFPSRQYMAPKVRLFLEALAALVEPMEPLEVASHRPRSQASAPDPDDTKKRRQRGATARMAARGAVRPGATERTRSA